MTPRSPGACGAPASLLFRRTGEGAGGAARPPGWPVLGHAATSAPGRSPRANAATARTRCAAARREFAEELGSPPPDGEEPLDLGEIRQKAGKLVRAWALAGDLDPSEIHSNTFEMEWPPRSGRMQEFPEVDRAAVVRAGRGPRADQPGPGGASLDGARGPGEAVSLGVSPGDNISPTAHYTGEVWRRAGLSHPWLGTREGRVMFDALHPLMSGQRAHSAARRWRPTCWPATGRSTRSSSDAIERHGDHPGDRGRRRDVAARLALCQPLRRPAHLRRGRSAGDGGSASGERSGADRLAVGRTTGSWRTSMRCARTVPAASTQSAGELDPDRGRGDRHRGPARRTCPPDAVLALWARFAQRAGGVLRPGATSPICTSAASRGPRSASSAWLLAAFVRGRVYLHFDERRRRRGRSCAPAGSPPRRCARPRTSWPSCRATEATVDGAYT